MSMHGRRNVIIPLWFAIFALAAFFLPSGAFGWSLFLLVLGLTVPEWFTRCGRTPRLSG